MRFDLPFVSATATIAGLVTGAVDFEDERCTLARYRTIIRAALITAIVTVHAAFYP